MEIPQRNNSFFKFVLLEFFKDKDTPPKIPNNASHDIAVKYKLSPL